MATQTTPGTLASNPAGDAMNLHADARYRSGADYWKGSSGGPGPQLMAADTLTGD